MKKENKKWSIQISKSAANKLKKFCKKYGYTMSGFVESCLEDGYQGKELQELLKYLGNSLDKSKKE